MFSSSSAGSRCARVVFVRMVTKWRRFHFSQEALKEGSSNNSLALRRGNSPLMAILVKNKMMQNEIP